MLLFGVMLLSFCCVIYRVVFIKNVDGSVQSGSAGDLQSGLMALA